MRSGEREEKKDDVVDRTWNKVDRRDNISDDKDEHQGFEYVVHIAPPLICLILVIVRCSLQVLMIHFEHDVVCDPYFIRLVHIYL